MRNKYDYTLRVVLLRWAACAAIALRCAGADAAGDSAIPATRCLRPFEIAVEASPEERMPAINVINGSGMAGELCDNLHEGTWYSPSGPGPLPGTAGDTPAPDAAVWIRFEFDRVHALREMRVWNYNESIGRGLKTVEIHSTADGRSWTNLGRFEFALASGKPGYGHNTTIDFAGRRVRGIAIYGITNHGEPLHLYGLSEVRFVVDDDNTTVTHSPFAGQLPPLNVTLQLRRGLAIDRTYHAIPDQPRFTSEDARYIKSLGFGFVKILINPQFHKEGVELRNMEFVDASIRRVVDAGLPVLVCVHPEADFKRTMFSDRGEFDRLCAWYERLGAHLAGNWTPSQFAFQQMTEPFGDSGSLFAWNHWNRLLPEMWHAIRRGMPKHTLVLSGTQSGRIGGLFPLRPVPDGNVMYAFSYYEPFTFTFQGAPWMKQTSATFPYLRNVPYPADLPAILQEPDSLIFEPPDDVMRARARNELLNYGTQQWNRERHAESLGMLAQWSDYYQGKLAFIAGEFGCYQGAAPPADRCRYVRDVREVLEEFGCAWSYWSYNETCTIMDDRLPRKAFGSPRESQPDQELLRALLDRRDPASGPR
jgi:endoglucanase